MPEHRRAAALAVAAAVLLICAGCASPSPTAVAGRSAAPSASRDTGAAGGVQQPVAAAPAPSTEGVPTRVVIPSIGVDAPLEHLQRDSTGVLQPPRVLMDAGWYSAGTVPGDVGPAVIAGHVDWVDRIAVFHRLSTVRPGAEIDVRMSGGPEVRFTVDRVETVSKFSFPTREVYGATPDPELRVITCGGPWDDARDIYSDNVVVFATLR